MLKVCCYVQIFNFLVARSIIDEVLDFTIWVSYPAGTIVILERTELKLGDLTFMESVP